VRDRSPRRQRGSVLNVDRPRWHHKMLATSSDASCNRHHRGRSGSWYVGPVIVLEMGRVEMVGMKPTISRQNIDRTTSLPEHETFWSTIFQRRTDVPVLTTHYDVLP
jgi:hypothetical protein